MKQYTLGVYEKAMPLELNFYEKLSAVKETGFDFLELSIDETDDKLMRLDMSGAKRKEIKCAMEEIGIPIRTMCLSGHRKYPLGSKDEAIRTQSLQIMEKAIALAEDLGIRMIQLAGYDVYYEESSDETKSIFIDNLRKAVEMAARAGVLLGFETMETEFMNTVEKAMKYVNLVQSVYLQVYPDVGNLTNAAVRYATDPIADFRLGKGHIAAVHLKETKPDIFREVPFGLGHVDFENMIENAWSLGVRKYVAEFWYTGNPLWKQDMCDASEMMRGILRKHEINT
ncbi:L-ribulose-5-phosphate 3-epimerase [Lachnospiraceae bacterium ZAX-1]